jgi:hypothetical protein
VPAPALQTGNSGDSLPPLPHLMSPSPCHLSPRQTLHLILVPLLLTFAGPRLFLHLIGVHHVYPGGYLVHHLFFGTLMVLPAAFVLAFGPQSRRSAVLSRIVLGSGSAMILDEIVFLVATKTTDADYVSAVSLRGALLFIAGGILLLWFLHRRCRD